MLKKAIGVLAFRYTVSTVRKYKGHAAKGLT